MTIRKVLYNKFIFIWCAFGFTICTYSLIKSISNGDFSKYDFTTIMAVLMPTLITGLYVGGYIRYKIEK